MKRGTKGVASLVIDASPETLYDLVSDVRRMGEWSPECRRCRWVGGATGPVVGARFKGTNRRGLVRWTQDVEVRVARKGREFAFVTCGSDPALWTYRFEPHDGGTTVTESFELLADLPLQFALIERWIMGIKDRKADLEAGMRATLERLKAAAENTSDTRPSTRSRGWNR